MSETLSIKKTPLYDRHVSAGGKMVEFAGYQLPIQYEGIIAEHETVRTKAGIFDLTHMGEIEIRGAGAIDFTNNIITNDISTLPIGAIVYTTICREDGGILDDALVYQMEDRIYMVVNASNKDKIYRWLIRHEREDVRIMDLSEKTALIAVQGPVAEKIVQKITPVDLSKMEYYHFEKGKILDASGIISRTGYTGEDGFEIYVNNQDAEAIWDALMVEGEPYGMKPIGLGARDTLRFEAKYALYGNELNENRNPIEVGLKWVVGLNKSDFIGKSAIMKVVESKPARKLVGFEMKKPGVPRHDYKVFSASGEEIGVVTSGTHSPTLKKALGLALIKREGGKIGEEIFVEIRGKKVPATIIKTPFYSGSVKSNK